MSAAEIPDLKKIPGLKLPPPKLKYPEVNIGSILYGRKTPRYVEEHEVVPIEEEEEEEEREDEDFRAIESAKNKYPRYSSKVIFFDILKKKVPLYKFKKSYSDRELFTWFTMKDLKELKTEYEEKGIQEEDAAFMDELITRKEEYLREQHEQSERVKNLQKNFNEGQGPSCVTMGGRINNTFRKKNKSNKSKSKRVNKRIKKNKRYSRKYSRK
jgi:hypothetical protein